MEFNSLKYLIFCPIIFFLYWLSPNRYKWIIVLAASCYFYMSWNAKYIVLIFLVTLVSYLCALYIERAGTQRRKKAALISTLVICFGLLFIFKYFNFAMNTVNSIFRRLAIPLSATTLKLILPVGISFYTFQTLSYVIDVYRGELKCEHHFGKYAAFVSFFPQLVAGPIERAGNLLTQINNPKKFDHDNAVYGVRKMLLGFFKKVVIADNLAAVVNYVFANLTYVGGYPLLIASVCFTFQIYCDFSGYSDIAIGTAKLFNIQLVENFKAPYFAASVKEFWRRWHISLSNWFRDYVYIPLGGNKKGKIRQKLNLMIVFFVSGLWHGAAWNYVIWGLMHGVAQIVLPAPKKDKQDRKPIWWIKVLATFCFVSVTWIFFRMGIRDAFQVLTHMFDNTFTWGQCIDIIVKGAITTRMRLIVVSASVVMLMVFDYFSMKRDLLSDFGRFPFPIRCIVYSGIIVFILFCMPFVHTTQFIYFQF